MVGAAILTSSSPLLRLQRRSCCSISCCSNLENPDDFIHRKTQSPSTHQHHLRPLSISKPTFIIRSESNIRKIRTSKPEPSCVVCNGSGKVECRHCLGQGRTNFTELMILPKGKWPKWCKTCGGSGLAYCYRCLGTGEYVDILSFRI